LVEKLIDAKEKQENFNGGSQPRVNRDSQKQIIKQKQKTNHEA
jgi:hypothetical protein